MLADPTPAQHSRLERHLEELALWNRRLNLTAVPAEQWWVRHVGESLRLLEVAEPHREVRCADIGSGGGFPGVVIAVMRPDLETHLVESDQRKAAFLVHLCGVLGLTSVTVEARRAEDMGRDPAHRERYQVAVSRATAVPAVLAELALPLLHRWGSLWALVADAGAAASEAAMVTRECGGVARAPAADILRLEKLAATPAHLPRRGRALGRSALS